MPPNHSTAGAGIAGRPPPQPPRRSSTLSSIFGAKKEKKPKVETREVFIPKYELAWSTLKAWLDTRFAKYDQTFTDTYRVSGDKYVVNLPEDLTEDDERDIALLK